jgi:O-antigen/teichoic acid export membrane protein
MSDVTRKAAQGTAFHLGAQLALMLCSYLSTVILARALGPAAYGVYGIVYSFLVAVELLGRAGLGQAMSKLIADTGRSEPATEATGLTLSIGAYLVLFVVVLVGAPALGALFAIPDGARLFRIAALDIPVYGLYATLFHILNGRRAFLHESLSLTIYGVTRVVGVLVLVAMGATAAGALVVNVIVSGAGLAYAVHAVGLAPFRPTLVKARPILRLAPSMAAVAIGAQILPSVDLWVLGAVGAAGAKATMGFYVAAATIAKMPNFIANSVSAALLPSIAAALGTGDRAAAERALEGAMRFMLMVVMPACVLVALNARPLVALLFSSAYADGGRYLAVLVLAQGFFLTFYLALGIALIGAGRSGIAGILALVVVPVAIVIDVLLVLALGAMGAAIGALVATGVAALVAAIMVHRLVGPLGHLSTLLRVALVTAIVAVPSILIHAEGLLLLVELAILGLIGLGLFFALGVVRMADLEPFLPASLASRIGVWERRFPWLGAGRQRV